MISGQILECVPNFSEGRDEKVISQIAAAIESVKSVYLLNIDSGKAANRTVMTFAGATAAVAEAAFRAIEKASELIDMQGQKGVHPRFGATDVCPFVPIHDVSMEEAILIARQVGQRVGKELKIPVFLYENAAYNPERKNLSLIRAGEFEQLPEKLQDPFWHPDFGPSKRNEKAGAIAVGARKLLIAYNVNLNTSDPEKAKRIAERVRETGYYLKDPNTGKSVRDKAGNSIRATGALKSVKAIAWFIEDFDKMQISMNLTDLDVTPLHIAYETVKKEAASLGVEVTGSEVVGMVPADSLIAAGHFYQQKEKDQRGLSERELVNLGIDRLGLRDVKPFIVEEKVIGYRLERMMSRKF